MMTWSVRRFQKLKGALSTPVDGISAASALSFPESFGRDFRSGCLLWFLPRQLFRKGWAGILDDWFTAVIVVRLWCSATFHPSVGRCRVTQRGDTRRTRHAAWMERNACLLEGISKTPVTIVEASTHRTGIRQRSNDRA